MIMLYNYNDKEFSLKTIYVVVCNLKKIFDSQYIEVGKIFSIHESFHDSYLNCALRIADCELIENKIIGGYYVRED